MSTFERRGIAAAWGMVGFSIGFMAYVVGGESWGAGWMWWGGLLYIVMSANDDEPKALSPKPKAPNEAKP